MAFIPFKDRFENTKKVVQGKLSGSAIFPLSQEPVSSSVPKSGSNTSDIDHLRQGIEIINNNFRFIGVQPKISSNSEDNFIEIDTFGIAKDFDDETVFQDIPKLDPKTYLQDADGSAQYPAILQNVSLREPNQMDGVLEPLTIRSKVAMTSIDFPFEAHDIKATLMDGNTDAFGRTDVIEQFIEKKNPRISDPYLDSINSFGLTARGSVLLEGVVSDKVKEIHAFDETAFDQFLSSSITAGSLIKTAISMSHRQSGSYFDLGLIDYNKKSSAAGNFYFSAVKEGTDSIAFGDMGTYRSRGFIRELDSLTGSYPTIMRTGDKDRKGNFKVLFDDTNTIIFEENASSVNIGRNLHSSSIYLAKGFLSETIQRRHPRTGLPNYPFIGQRNIVRTTSGSIIASGTIRRGVADSLIVFSEPNEERITPFDETFTFESEEASHKDPFWMTGSKIEDVGLYFSSPLKSKTKIEIDLTPSEQTVLGVDNSSNANNFPMGYYNVKKKKWEGIGQAKAFITASTSAEDIDHFENGYIGFTVSSNSPTFSNFHTRRTYGAPCSNYGFPIHPKFHATGSQLYHLSNSISHPFLLEKIVYQFSASYNDQGRSSLGTDAPINTFFILNQRENFHTSQRFTNKLKTPSEVNVVLSSSIPAPVILSKGASKTKVKSARDLITFAQISSQHSSITSSNEPELSRDLNIKNLPANYLWSGSFILSASAKTPAYMPEIQTFTNGITRVFAASNDPGGRNNLEFGTGREFIKTIRGAIASGTITDGTASISAPKSSSFDDPYILFPGDKLVFGWQVPFDYKPYEEDNFPQFTIFPGKGKLILYGSLIRDKKEFHDTLNENLTSNAINETLFSDYGLDQYDTEPYQFLSGTYIDDYITGSMSNDVELHRKILGSTFGQNGSLSGTFFRNVQLHSLDERYFDTLLPDPQEITKINGAKVLGTKQKFNSITIGHIVETENASTLYDTDWIRGFPFEARYSTANRLTKPFEGITGEVDPAGTALTKPSIHKRFMLSQSLNGNRVIPILAEDTTSGDASSRFFSPAADAIKHYYGIGDNISGSAEYKSTGANFGAGSIIRGWKYGILNGLPQYTKAVFRRDRYGQFRDMLEQRQDSKFFIENSPEGGSPTVSSPINVVFIADKPSQTLSSNLSNEATSSIPFRDGLVSDREDPLNSDINTAIFTLPV